MKWISFNLSILILSVSIFKNVSCSEVGCSNETNCPITPCLSYTTLQFIQNLWDLPKQPLTPLLLTFKNEIIQHIRDKCATERQLSVLVGLTVWAVNRLTNFNPTPSPSCVFGTLVNESNGVYEGNCRHALNRAIKKFYDLTLSAITYSVDIGLSASGCPSAVALQGNSSIECNLDLNELFKGLRISRLNVPDNVSQTIKLLLKSKCVDEQQIGLSSVAMATETASLFFYRLYPKDGFLKMMRLVSCPIPVQTNCCNNRKQLLKESANLMSTTAINILQTIMKANEE